MTTPRKIRDEFLSEEDLDLKNLTWDELLAYWNLWLEQAQATNDLDKDEYSHGVFSLWGPSYRKRREELLRMLAERDKSST